MAIDGKALGAIAVGGVFAWSGLNNKKITMTLQDLIKGTKPVPGPVANYPSSVGAFGGGLNVPSGSAGQLAVNAVRYQGHCYNFGGSPGPTGAGCWDCSSFTNWVAGHDTGLAIPGFNYPQYQGQEHGPATGTWLIWSGLYTVGHDGNMAQAGDLAIWQTHMGICLGPNQMISAQNPKDGTKISAINNFIPEFLFIRRYKSETTAGIAHAGRH